MQINNKGTKIMKISNQTQKQTRLITQISQIIILCNFYNAPQKEHQPHIYTHIKYKFTR